MIKPADDSLVLASELCRRADRPEPVSVEMLTGGKNNRVYQVNTIGAEPLVMKLYHVDQRDTRNRLGQEWQFLEYVWQRGVRLVPQPLTSIPEKAVALYSHISGRKAAASEIYFAMVDQAADFIIAINAAPREPQTLMPGSESCFSVADHVATVEKRVARLASLDETAPYKEQAEVLISEELLPAWKHVREDLIAAFDNGTEAELVAGEQCVSPSDFGFHNALVGADGRVHFIDFEYAGRDDPAKLVCDFFCSPEIPVPMRFLESFVARLSAGLSLNEAFEARCRSLIDAYRIKWTCIILNDFLSLGAARREFASGDKGEIRCAVQLAKAAAKLAEIGLK